MVPGNPQENQEHRDPPLTSRRRLNGKRHRMQGDADIAFAAKALPPDRFQSVCRRRQTTTEHKMEPPEHEKIQKVPKEVCQPRNLIPGRTLTSDDDVCERLIPEDASLRTVDNFDDEGGGFVNAKAEDIRRFFQDSNESILLMNCHCRRFLIGAALLWLLLLGCSYAYAFRTGQFHKLKGIERAAPATASGVLILSWVSFFLPRLIRDGRITFTSSSITVSASYILLIQAFTEAIIAHAYVPLLVDGVVGMRVETVRWSSYPPLTAVLIFFTEAVSIAASRDEKSRRRAVFEAYYISLTLGTATFLGLVWPFCSSVWVWLLVFSTSLALFVQIYVLWFARRKAFSQLTEGNSAEEVEYFLYAKISLRMLTVCVVMWTSFVIVWSVSALSSVLAPEDSPWRVPWLAEVYDSVMDVVAKVIYVSGLFELHDCLVDGNARVRRRLTELKELMGAVLDKSTDVICFSRRTAATDDVMTMVSPSIRKLLRKLEDVDVEQFDMLYSSDATEDAATDEEEAVSDDTKVLIFRLRQQDIVKSSAFKSQAASCTNPGSMGHTPRSQGAPHTDRGAIMDDSVVIDRRLRPLLLWNVDVNEFKERFFPAALNGPAVVLPEDLPKAGVPSGDHILSLATLAARVWKAPVRECIFPHELLGAGGRLLRCEVKISRIDDDSVVFVIRDLSETLLRLEAERAARLKDAEANRFTKHEVKNGLLAAMGLCDSLQLAVEGMSGTPDGSTTLDPHGAPGEVSSAPSPTPHQHSQMPTQDPTAAHDLRRSITAVATCSFELNTALKNILETVLAESMARDLINENYNPKLESVNVPTLIRTTTKVPTDRMNRFPLLCADDFPTLELDPDLIRCIHRNAISNACKYGRNGGEVRTELRYNKGNQTFVMEVINLPGDRHNDLIRMGKAARDAVFSPRSRLHMKGAIAGRATGGNGGNSAERSGRHTPNEAIASYNPRHSAGDGAWIMTKCAKTLGGTCDIEFQPDRTVFTLRCPAKLIDPTDANGIYADPNSFALPRNVRAIVIDDCKIQRKILKRFLGLIGVPDDRCTVLGETNDDILGFEDVAFDYIHRYAEDYFLVIADENLDMPDPTSNCPQGSADVRMSGSLCLSNIRSRLLPHEERRLLAVVRSANDSVQDVAIYNSRAHGYLAKGPISKDKVMAQLAPLWRRRFPS